MIEKMKSWRRFHVPQEVDNNFRETFAEVLNEKAFRPPLSPLHMEEVFGWVQFDNMLGTNFDVLNTWSYNQYLVFTLRIDKKVLPPHLFKASVKERVDSWCRENHRERAPAAVKTEIKENVRAEMARATLPRTTLVPIVWDIQEKVLYVGSTATPAIDHARKLFFRTFGTPLEPGDAGVLLPDQLEAMTAATGDWRNTVDPAEFLRWLWWSSESETREDFEVWVDDKAVLRPRGEDKAAITVARSATSSDPSAKAALRDGASVKSLRLCLRRDEREYALTLSEPTLPITSAKLPALVRSTDQAEAIYERLFLMEEAHFLLQTLVGEFVDLRTADDVWAQHLRDIEAWVIA